MEPVDRTTRSKRPFIILAVAASLMLVAGLLAFVGTSDSGRTLATGGGLTKAEYLTSLEKCGSGPDILGCSGLILNDAFDHEGATFAIDLLDATQTIPNFLIQCHQLVHALGQHAYTKVGAARDAINAGSPGCQGGYYHGIVEAAGENMERQAFISQFSDFCADVVDKNDNGTCLHGIGHGVYYNADSDTSVGAAVCDTIRDRDFRIGCLDGVYMAYGTDFQLENKSITRLDNCLTLSDPDWRDACLKNGFLFINPEVLPTVGGLKALQSFCKKLSGADLESCWTGLGYGSLSMISDSAPFIEIIGVCGLPGDSRPLDVSGLRGCIDYAINGQISRKPADAVIKGICDLLTTEGREYCVQAVEKARGNA